MTGIFDSIIDSISGFDDWKKLAGAASNAFTASEKANAANREKGINEGVSMMPMNQKYDASKSSPAEAPNPRALEQMWYERLNRFAELQSTVSKPRY